MHIKYFRAVIIFPKAIDKSISNVGLQSCIFKKPFLDEKVALQTSSWTKQENVCHRHYKPPQLSSASSSTKFCLHTIYCFHYKCAKFGIPNAIRKYTTTAI